jgi:nitrous oxidase accessory protein NosD
MWVAPPVVVKAQVLTVGAGFAYPTITAALEAARSGDTVEVAAGEYNEAVRLKSGVTLRGSVPREAVLRAAPLTSGPAVTAENVTGARLSGFRILAARDLPIPIGILLDNSTVEVDDVEIEGAGIGVEIRGIASPWLRANSIYDCSSEGVLIRGASQAWISHNDIRRNKGAGLAARDGAKPALLQNVFEKNWVDVPLETMVVVKEQNQLLDVPAGGRRPAVPAAKKQE